MRTVGVLALSATFAVAGACALPACGAGAHGGATSPARRAHPRAGAPPRRTVTAPGTLDASAFWEACEVALDDPPIAPPLPLRLEGDVEPDAATAVAADDLRANGFALGTDPRAGAMAAFYTDSGSAPAPVLVTFDVLFELVHLALAAALAEVEARVTTPELAILLPRVERRLAAEAKGARPDLEQAYLVARGLVAVARALFDAKAAPARELAAAVNADLARVRAHAGVATSATLGVPMDFSLFAPRAGAKKSPAASALAWLATAPLLLEGRDAPAGPRVDVSRVRAHTRAALLLARSISPEIEPEAARAWSRIESVEQFFTGGADDLTPRELAATAKEVGVDLADGKAIADVAKIDRVRHAASRGDKVSVYDGAGDVRVVGPEKVDVAREALSVRLLGARATPDAELFQATVFPAEPDRRMPRAASLVAWLTAPPASPSASTDDAAPERGPRRFSADPHVRHASVYLSALDAIATWLAPSAARRTLSANASAAYRARVEQTALAAWTTLRHDLASPGRPALATAPSARGVPSATAPPPDPRATVYVEPHPEAVGRLLSLVRQLESGLVAAGALVPGSPARSVVADVEQLLTVAFEASLLAADDEAPSPEQAATLAALPGWLGALESALGSTTARAVDVHTDLATKRALEEAVPGFVPLELALRVPGGAGRVVVARGPVLAHEELEAPARARLTDDTWRGKP